MRAAYGTVIVQVALLAGGLFAHFLPRWTRPSLFFGVTVPPGFRDTVAARRTLRLYRTVVWVIVLALVASAEAVPVRIVAPVLWLLLIAGVFLAIGLAHARALGHAVKPTSAVEVDLAAPADRAPVAMLLAVVPLAWLSALGIWGALYPQQLPARFAHHGVLLTLLAIRTWICLVMALAAWATLHWSRRISATGAAAESERRFRRLFVVFIIACEYLQLIGPTVSVLHPSVGASVVAAIAVLSVIVALGWRLTRVGQGGSRLPGAAGAAPVGDRTADRDWKWGLFYFNRADPALMIEKRVGIGYTLNFGNPLSWAVLAGVLVVPLLMTGLLLHELMG